MGDINFAEGLYFKEPSDKAPEFIIGKLSIQKEKFTAWLENTPCDERGYINLGIKISRAGKPYIAVDDWKPEKQGSSLSAEEQAELDRPLPNLDEQGMDDDQAPF